MVFVGNFVTVENFNIKKFLLLLRMNCLYIQWTFIKSSAFYIVLQYIKTRSFLFVKKCVNLGSR